MIGLKRTAGTPKQPKPAMQTSPASTSVSANTNESVDHHTNNKKRRLCDIGDTSSSTVSNNNKSTVVATIDWRCKVDDIGASVLDLKQQMQRIEANQVEILKFLQRETFAPKSNSVMHSENTELLSSSTSNAHGCTSGRFPHRPRLCPCCHCTCRAACVLPPPTTIPLHL